MIVKESRIKTHGGAGALSRHMLHGAKNEAIRILAGSDWLMRDAMREARREGLTYGLRHIAFNPAEPMTDIRHRIRQAIQEQQAILDQRAPEEDWAPLKREEMLAKWRKALTPYQKQLRSSFTRYRRAKKEWEQAEESRWQRMTGRAGKLAKVCQQLLLKFLEVLRFVVQALLHIVGLRSTPPEPVRSILTEQDRPVLEEFRKQYDAEFSAMAGPEKLEPWLQHRFDRLVQARTNRIRQWDKAHQSEKGQAKREISRLRSKLVIPKGIAGNMPATPSQPSMGH
ncbi:MAG: hypothetical protein ABF641_06375 [Acetobacter sp.]